MQLIYYLIIFVLVGDDGVFGDGFTPSAAPADRPVLLIFGDGKALTGGITDPLLIYKLYISGCRLTGNILPIFATAGLRLD